MTVNDAQINYVALELPMGGWKESGLGIRHGADGIRKYTKKQTLLVTKLRADEARRPHDALQRGAHEADRAAAEAGLRTRRTAKEVREVASCYRVPADAPRLALVSGNPADRSAAHRVPLRPSRLPAAPDAGRRAGARLTNARGESWGIMRCSKLDRGNYRCTLRDVQSTGTSTRPGPRMREARRRSPARHGPRRQRARPGAPHGHSEIITRSWSGGDDERGLLRLGGHVERVDRTLAHREHPLGLSLAGARGRHHFWARAGLRPATQLLTPQAVAARDTGPRPRRRRRWR